MKIKKESQAQRREICHKSDCYDRARETCNRCLLVTKNNKEHQPLVNTMEFDSPDNLFWQNENQQFTIFIAFAGFSLLILGLYLLPSSTDMIPSDLLWDNIPYSDDLNTREFWVGVISSGFFFSPKQMFVKTLILLVYTSFLGVIVGFFTYTRSFQDRKDLYCS